jgi:tetratricopeptide (TPR) repeat protein
MHCVKRAGLVALIAAVSTVSGWTIQPDNHERLRSFLAAAQQAAARKDFSAAADSYREATELEPNIPELWANLGLMYHQTGNYTEAIESFKKAERLNGDLFVPQLFLGIEYLELKNPSAALPYLEKAVRLNPNDLQAELSLGKAFESENRADRAADAYLRATEINPNNGNAWLELGTTLLEQVENDARVMTSTYNSSPYVKLKAAETFAEEDKLSPAENAFKAAINSSPPAPCAHAELGITLLREDKRDEARQQFQMESKSGTHCGLAAIGTAVVDLDQGHVDIALQKLASIANADSGFVRTNLPLFRGSISPEQLRSLIELARSRRSSEKLPADFSVLIDKALSPGEGPSAMSFAVDETAQATGLPKETAAEQLYASGQYGLCDEALKPTLKTSNSDQQKLLATCSYSTGDFETALFAAERMKSNSATMEQGLYWESKADEKLAVAALARAGEIDPDSPQLHVLTGDSFRQQRRWSDAEAEYRKAVALDPKSRVARLSLAIALFTELKNDEALSIDKSVLADSQQDPEANLLAAEILVQEHKFQDAEPYLSNCKNLKPELVPRVHILRGEVYAETGRTTDAIAEYKLGIAGDEDGSIHYQLARLYQKAGDKTAAAEEIRLSKQLRERWDNQAHLDMGQPLTATSRE